MSAPRVGFVLEQSLGHKTHADNLKQLLPLEPSIDAEIMEIDWDVHGAAARVPLFNSNWTVRSSVRARRAIQRAQRSRRLDALFIHTQVPAVLVSDLMASIPTVVSVDATPLQYDDLGEHYRHETGGRRVEQLKWRANQRVFERAAHIVTWSEWAKAGVVDGYGIDPSKITVIPPGVVTSIWDRGATPPPDGGQLRILFVGGDLGRKGGTVLIEAFTRLRAALAADPDWRHLQLGLDLVTQSDVDDGPGITVHRGLGPNSPALVDLFCRAAVFCLPTRGDCLPMVLSEAGAAGLPIISTPMAAIPEIVRDGDTGFLVGVDDVDTLTDRLATLVREPSTRERLGANAHALVEAQYDATANVTRLTAILAEVATRNRARSDRGRVLLTVSGQVPEDVAGLVDRGERPAPDYVALAKAMDADVVDVPEARRRAGRMGALVERLAGSAALLGWVCFRERSQYDAVLTDGEQVGLPLAMLCRLTGRRRFAHVMIVHIMSVPKKAIPFRLLRLGSYIDTMVLYSSAQQRFVVDELAFPADRAVLSSFAVDTAFFDPNRVTPLSNGRRVVSSAGLEFRDYPTLMVAAEGIDARFVLAAASPWSKRTDSTEAAIIPANVEVCRLGFVELRQLYADSDLVVVPLYDVAFQAGVTTILEAMAMGKTVVCSRTQGQTDLIVDGVTGVYVPPGDPEPLRETIEALFADPARAKEIGGQARRYAQHVADVAVYADRLAAVVDAAGRRHGR